MTADPPKTVIVSAALIQDAAGCILLARRPSDRPLAGKWEFPGGKAEPGEDPRPALVRECREELGITVSPGHIYETIFVPGAPKSYLLLFYVATIVDGQPQSLEGNEFAWVPLHRLHEYDILEADRPLVTMLQHRPLPR